VFNDKLCKSSFLEAWRTTSSHPAVLYHFFCWSTLHQRWLRNPEEKNEPHEAIPYYAHVVSLINRRVQDPKEATNDLTIRLVIMLLFYNVSVYSFLVYIFFCPCRGTSAFHLCERRGKE
jgi:hypothetical protein